MNGLAALQGVRMFFSRTISSGRLRGKSTDIGLRRGRCSRHRRLFLENLESRSLLAFDLGILPLVEFRLEAVDSAGELATQVDVGESILVNVYVKDNSAEGIFAAYADLDYSADLLAPAGNAVFSADFRNFHHAEFKRGQIDDAGAAAGFSPTGDRELLLMTFPFTAVRAGSALIETSPADDLPAHDTLVFGNNTPVPTANIHYGSQRIVVGSETPGDPQPPLQSDTVQLTTFVTDLQGNPLEVVSVGTEFFVEIHADDLRADGHGLFAFNVDLPYDARLLQLQSVQFSDDYSNGRRLEADVPGHLFVTAFGGLNGTSPDDQELIRARFVATAVGETALFVRPIEELPAAQWLLYGLDHPLALDQVAANGAVLRVRSAPSVEASADVELRLLNRIGEPITEAVQGTEFILEAWVRDTRTIPEGLFAAYVDVEFDDTVISVLGPFEHGPDFGLVLSGRVNTDGQLDEVGGLGGLSSTDPAAGHLLFRVPLRADGNGTVTFQSNPADLRPFHDILAYGWNFPVDSSSVRFGSATLQVTAATGAVPTGADRYELLEDSQLHVSAEDGVLANDGAGSSALAAMVVAPRNGAIVFRADGSFDYQPYSNVFGIDRFQYVVVDQNQSSVRTVVELQIAAKPDAPLSKPDSYQVDAGQRLFVPAMRGVLSNDWDPDRDVLTARLEIPPAHGSLTLSDDGSVDYLPESGFVGKDFFAYRAFDGKYMSAPVFVELASGQRDSVMRFELSALNLVGAPIRTTSTGADFQLVVRAQDLREDGLGILNADVSLAIDQNLFEVVDVQLDSLFSLFGEASVADGVVQLSGSTGFHSLTENQSVELGRVTLRGLKSSENVVFAPHTQAQSQNYLTGFAVNDEVLSLVPDNLIELQQVSLKVDSASDPTRPQRSPWQNQNPYDVNNDGTVHAVDAAHVISMINFLVSNASAEGPERMSRLGIASLFSDINGDFDTTPQDGILIINYLNDQLRRARALPTSPGDKQAVPEGEAGLPTVATPERAASHATVTTADIPDSSSKFPWNDLDYFDVVSSIWTPTNRRKTARFSR